MTNRIGTGDYHPHELKAALDSYLTRHRLNKLKKRERILAWLICASKLGHKVTRFDAEWVGDHCFNTTISEIFLIDGIRVEREQTKVPNRFGGFSDCKQYWLPEASRLKAELWLGIEV